MFWRKTCLRIKFFKQNHVISSHHIEWPKQWRRKKWPHHWILVREIFLPLRTSNLAFISNHYSAKNLGMSSKCTWYKYERRFFMPYEDITNMCRFKHLWNGGTPWFLCLWRGKNLWNYQFDHVRGIWIAVEKVLPLKCAKKYQKSVPAKLLKFEV